MRVFFVLHYKKKSRKRQQLICGILQPHHLPSCGCCVQGLHSVCIYFYTCSKTFSTIIEPQLTLIQQVEHLAQTLSITSYASMPGGLPAYLETQIFPDFAGKFRQIWDLG